MTPSFADRHPAVVTALVLTGAYTLILLFISIVGQTEMLPTNPVTGLLGLFVPSAVFVTLLTRGVAPLIVLICCYHIDLKIVPSHISYEKKALIILGALFILTNVFDLVLFQEFISFKIFLATWGMGEYPIQGL